MGAGAVGVEFASYVPRPRGQVTLLEYLPQLVPLEDGEVEQAPRAQLHEARHDGHDQRPLRRQGGHGRQGRHLPDGRPGGQGARGAPRRADARRHRPRREHRGHRPRDRPRWRSTGRHPGRRPDAHQGAAPLRHRRHRSAGCGSPTWPATRASRRPTPSPARPSPRRSTTSSSRAPPTAGRRSPRSGGPRSRESAGIDVKIGKVPFQAIGKALIGGEYEGFAKVIADTRQRRHARRPHDRSARDRPHRRGQRSVMLEATPPGRSARRPTRTRRCPRRSARRRWPSTAGRSTSRRTSEARDRRPDRRPDSADGRDRRAGRTLASRTACPTPT